MTHAEIITALAKADPAKVRVEWEVRSAIGHDVVRFKTRETAESVADIVDHGSVARVLVVEAPEA